MSAMDVLPREVLAKCLEFLAFDQAVEAKQVSKDVRSAARRALIVHWRPIKFVAERGDLVRALTNPSVTVDAAALATFRAAWELDPGLVVFEMSQHYNSYETATFLALVEPTIDGLPRVVAAIERTHRFKNSSHSFGTNGTLYDRVAWPNYVLVRWSVQIGHQLRLSPDYDWDADIDQSLFILSSSEGGLSGCELFGSGLEAWADQDLAADFVFGLVRSLERDHDHDVYLSTVYHERWTNHWQDRSKADAFMEAAAELLDREDNA
jgi:hypothetical protein